MRFVRESIGPKLLRLTKSKDISLCMLGGGGIVFLVWFVTGFPRLPYCLELTLLLFVALRFGHIINRVYLGFVENDVIKKLYKESKICYFDFVFGDLVGDFVLCVLTAVYYYAQCEVSGIYSCPALCIYAFAAFWSHMEKCQKQSIKRSFTEKHNLNIGYGLAYFFYYNYLVHLIKDDQLSERFREYVCEEEVSLSSNKLFILVPYNCVVEKYIDNDPCRSLRTKETKPIQLDVAGIKGRIYVNTVYELFTKGPGDPDGIMRCVIECAQPLKQLRELYTLKRISNEEMLYERQSFIFNLEKFLHDDCDSFRRIILVPCDGCDDIVPSVKRAAKKCQESTNV